VPIDIEVDEFDQLSVHFLACDESDQPIGTARLLPDGKIGRVAVLMDWRQHGVGSCLMKTVLSHAAKIGKEQVSLHAQVSSIPFYLYLGFQIRGLVFFEAEIPHREMFVELPLYKAPKD